MSLRDELQHRLRIGEKSRAILENAHWQEIYTMARRSLFELWCTMDNDEDRDDVWAVNKALTVLQDVLEQTAYDARGSEEKH